MFIIFNSDQNICYALIVRVMLLQTLLWTLMQIYFDCSKERESSLEGGCECFGKSNLNENASTPNYVCYY